MIFETDEWTEDKVPKKPVESVLPKKHPTGNFDMKKYIEECERSSKRNKG